MRGYPPPENAFREPIWPAKKPYQEVITPMMLRHTLS
jgi:hypothetical protein